MARTEAARAVRRTKIAFILADDSGSLLGAEDVAEGGFEPGLSR